MRRFRWIPLLCGSFGLTAAAWAVPSQDVYKEAQLQETTARDPEAAIRLYKQYLAAPGDDRAAQANAYLHLGFCHKKLGQMEDAKAAWKTIVQDFSDQSASYAEALNQLQKLQASERIIEVRTSTTVVYQKVYEEPPARWMVEFPRGTYLHTVDGKGRLLDSGAGGSLGFVKYPQPNQGVGMEAGNIGASGPPSCRRNISYFMILARLEYPILPAFRAYAKGGPGTYFFNFSNDHKSETKLNLGGSLEAGFSVGMPRGFAFNVGYLFHTFLQSTPSQSFRDTIPAGDQGLAADVTQNHGLRLVGGPDVSLSIRW